MLSDTEIRENLTAQVHELEALQSVYPKELKLTDHGVVADINDFISDNSKTDLPCRLEYNIQIPDINVCFFIFFINHKLANKQIQSKTFFWSSLFLS